MRSNLPRAAPVSSFTDLSSFFSSLRRLLGQGGDSSNAELLRVLGGKGGGEGENVWCFIFSYFLYQSVEMQ